MENEADYSYVYKQEGTPVIRDSNYTEYTIRKTIAWIKYVGTPVTIDSYDTKGKIRYTIAMCTNKIEKHLALSSSIVPNAKERKTIAVYKYD